MASGLQCEGRPGLLPDCSLAGLWDSVGIVTQCLALCEMLGSARGKGRLPSLGVKSFLEPEMETPAKHRV